MDRLLLISQLKAHEGMRLKPYRCTAGKLTIGIGRNLDDLGISVDEAMYLLDNDITAVEKRLVTIPAYRALDDVRQTVIANMAFNMGISKLRQFVKMWAALEAKQYDVAADEMLDSAWAIQVGQRAIELSGLMRDDR